MITTVARSDGRSGHQRHERVILVRGRDGVLTERRRHRYDELLARLHGFALDEQLAAGAPPEASMRLATRAAQLVSMRTRRKLARDWERLLGQADRPRSAADPRIPLVRREIDGARVEIDSLVAALRAVAPVTARGVAISQLLLQSGGSPVYSPRGSRVSLAAAIAEALRLLDPLSVGPLADPPVTPHDLAPSWLMTNKARPPGAWPW
ncbi:MAG: hypothetical protein JO147_00320 [Actinobacteria bacterium]|nr:hypothetical protein [Actinomycetota bacterium]